VVGTLIPLSPHTGRSLSHGQAVEGGPYGVRYLTSLSTPVHSLLPSAYQYRDYLAQLAG